MLAKISFPQKAEIEVCGSVRPLLVALELFFLAERALRGRFKSFHSAVGSAIVGSTNHFLIVHFCAWKVVKILRADEI